MSPGALRTWLRTTAPRPALGRAWELDKHLAEAARTHFSVRCKSSPPVPLGRPGRAASDETYVLDLCDEALGVPGMRQHRFDWLRGDPGVDGREVRLPVDAFYPTISLVIEYREVQHDIAIPIMDARPTISGVPRGEQRRRYDQRRNELVPAHGLRLVVIKPSDLDCTGRGRLRRRDRGPDLMCVRRLLSEDSHD